MKKKIDHVKKGEFMFMVPIYRVEFSSNSVEYELVLDAVSGSLYRIDFDD